MLTTSVSARRPIKLLGHELDAQPKRGTEGRLVNQRLEAAAQRLSELLGATRDAIALHRPGKALLLHDTGSSTRMLWVAQ
eukprot:9862553-Alexandrium_andersonii.AAC.1